MDFRFRVPDGETLALSDPTPVIERVLHAGADFWNVGSGDAGIEMGSEYDPLVLELYFGRGRFQVRYKPPSAWSLTAHGPDHAPRAAIIGVGGTPMTLKAETLLTRKATAEIVRHFCETGEKHPAYAWR
jgi:hypothetical protein